jgi:hypothetical protein
VPVPSQVEGNDLDDTVTSRGPDWFRAQQTSVVQKYEMVLDCSFVVPVDGWDLDLRGRLLFLKENQELADEFEISFHHITKFHVYLVHKTPPV